MATGPTWIDVGIVHVGVDEFDLGSSQSLTFGAPYLFSNK